MGRLLLVRHGQASWGSEDYDVLSQRGHQQAAVLGQAWRERGVVPDRVVAGSMRRHQESATTAGLEVDEIDAEWDEFDHVAMLARVPMPAGADAEPALFQQWFETATDRWTGGAHDDYDESFAAFTARVGAALGRLAEAPGTTAIFTSGGPIAWTASTLLADDHAQRVALWRRLNPVCVNSSVTTVVSGRRGLNLLTFNEHTHLEGSRELLSYR